MKVNNQKLKVLTPNGYELFLGVNKITKDKYIHLNFSNGEELKCSLDHPLNTINGIVKAIDLDKKTEIYSKNGGCFLISKRIIRKKISLYDIINSGNDHLYYTNNILSHNCSFLGSSDTLISGVKLQTLVYNKPIKSKKGLDTYEDPIEDHQYMVTVDVARGVDQDYSAFAVIDITQMPYRLVAKYRDNSIKPIMFPYIVKDVGLHYNKAFVLCETNDVGDQVANALHYDLEYPNLLTCYIKGRQGQVLGQGFGGTRVEYGVKMSKNVKKIGSINLKMLIEEDKLLFYDYDVINELSTFVQKSNTFMAEEGKNDDLVMCLVLFAWASTNEYFKEITDDDIRKRLFAEKIENEESDILPIGFLETGIEPQTFVQEDKVWEIVPIEEMMALWNYSGF